jgi:hypothetical protein
MFEISESQYKPVGQDNVSIAGRTYPRVVLDTLRGAVATGLIGPNDEVASVYHRRIQHGYPTPSLNRENVLREALPALKRHDVWSRGRFGSYRYEVANQDHSLMLGVEAVDGILFGSREMTLNHANIVNASKNVDMRWGRGGW